MDHCNGCETKISPIKVFERDRMTGKGWLITRCPKERCGFNLDIKAYEPLESVKAADNSQRFFFRDIF